MKGFQISEPELVRAVSAVPNACLPHTLLLDNFLASPSLNPALVNAEPGRAGF
jgi:hypothetical protein